MWDTILLIASLVIVAATFSALFFMWRKDDKEFSPEHVRNVRYDPETEILTFEGGVSGAPYKVRGRCTVWRSMSGKRLDTLTESKLSDIWDLWKYNNE